MRSLLKQHRGRLRRWAPCLAGPLFATLGLSGCAGFWDEVTSRNFHVKSLWEHPNPLVVLRESQDGELRAKALGALREPKQFGGSDKDQDVVVNVLVTAASNERQAYCRLAAIESLGHFKDPRAVKGLDDAFVNAGNGYFSPEQRTLIRCQALEALGEVGNPAALPRLIAVVSEPPAASTLSPPEKLAPLDLRLAAARALGHFKDPQAVAALVDVVKKEKDVALHDRVVASLELSTGKEVPADFTKWDEFVQPSPDRAVAEKEQSHEIKLLNFWQK